MLAQGYSPNANIINSQGKICRLRFTEVTTKHMYPHPQAMDTCTAARLPEKCNMCRRSRSLVPSLLVPARSVTPSYLGMHEWLGDGFITWRIFFFFFMKSKKTNLRQKLSLLPFTHHEREWSCPKTTA